MAKLKPMKDEKEIAAVPTSEPVLVVLDETPTSFEAGEAVQEPEQETQDDPIKVLEGQLKAAQEAEAAAKTRADKERADRLAAERREQEAARRVSVAESRTLETEEQAIESGLKAAQAQSEQAEADIAAAFEAGDAKKMAEAQRRLSRASSDVREFERATAALSDRKTTEKTVEQAAPQFTSVDASIDAQPHLTDAEKTWLKAHQDAWVDTARNNELSVAYNRAVKQGLTRSTPEYFKFIEEFMGYSKPATVENTDEERTTIVSAPVSRETRSSTTNQPNGNRVVLTPEQRDFARTMGLTDVQYASQVLRLNNEKKNNPERYSARS